MLDPLTIRDEEEAIRLYLVLCDETKYWSHYTATELAKVIAPMTTLRSADMWALAAYIDRDKHDFSVPDTIHDHGPDVEAWEEELEIEARSKE